jgi:hypothetical protein
MLFYCAPSGKSPDPNPSASARPPDDAPLWRKPASQACVPEINVRKRHSPFSADVPLTNHFWQRSCIRARNRRCQLVNLLYSKYRNSPEYRMGLASICAAACRNIERIVGSPFVWMQGKCR